MKSIPVVFMVRKTSGVRMNWTRGKRKVALAVNDGFAIGTTWYFSDKPTDLKMNKT